VWLSGVPVTVIGVAERTFTGVADRAPVAWAPFSTFDVIFHTPFDRMPGSLVDVVARVADSAGRQAAAEQLSAVATGITPALNVGNDRTVAPITGVRLDPADSRMSGHDAGAMRSLIALVLGVIALILLLAGANVANLLLASGATRTREMDVRRALGASGARLVRQTLTESLLLATTGGLAGLLLSYWFTHLLVAVVGAPAGFDASPDTRVWLFAAAGSLGTGLVAGLAPARQLLHRATNTPSSIGSSHDRTGATPRATRLRSIFIGAQAAASIVLLVCGALFTRGAWVISRVDLGFDADRLVTVMPALGTGTYDSARAVDYWRQARERMAAIGGVEDSSLTLYPPFSDTMALATVTQADQNYEIYLNQTDAGFFAATGLRLVRGRSYTADEVASGAAVAVVSERIAHDLGGGRDVIGRPLDELSPVFDKGVIVIGIAADALTRPLRTAIPGAVYQPMAADNILAARLLVRSDDPVHLAPQIRAAIGAVDPDIRLTVGTMAASVEEATSVPRKLAGLTLVLGALALVLAVTGMYGVTSFAAAERRQELGVRMAIGATASNILTLVIRDGMRPVVIGLAAGLALTLSAGPVLAIVLFGLSPRDPLAIGAASVVLLASALVANIIPARRAAAADPTSALRQT
jgi:predicted permease